MGHSIIGEWCNIGAGTSNSNLKNEVGGLSGKSIFLKSTLMLKKMFTLTNGQIPLIGVGGITDGLECYNKIKAGASLVPVSYTHLTLPTNREV